MTRPLAPPSGANAGGADVTPPDATPHRATRHRHAAAEPAPHPRAKHPRMTWMQRFDAANTTHDGRLTQAQAKQGYKIVARHFHEIDTEGKGYVTQNDIRAWHALQRAARHNHDKKDPLRPRPAFNRFAPDQRLPSIGRQTMLTAPAAPVATRVDLPASAPRN